MTKCVHEGEHPCPRRCLAPQVHTAQRPLQRVLHQIVGGAAIARQRAGIAPQPRNVLCDQAVVLTHDHPLSRSTRQRPPLFPEPPR